LTSSFTSELNLGSKIHRVSPEPNLSQTAGNYLTLVIFVEFNLLNLSKITRSLGNENVFSAPRRHTMKAVDINQLADEEVEPSGLFSWKGNARRQTVGTEIARKVAAKYSSVEALYNRSRDLKAFMQEFGIGIMVAKAIFAWATNNL
jgi:hypothetical protein